jgi:hypothetical protein
MQVRDDRKCWTRELRLKRAVGVGDDERRPLYLVFYFEGALSYPPAGACLFRRPWDNHGVGHVLVVTVMAVMLAEHASRLRPWWAARIFTLRAMSAARLKSTIPYLSSLDSLSILVYLCVSSFPVSGQCVSTKHSIGYHHQLPILLRPCPLPTRESPFFLLGPLVRHNSFLDSSFD